MVVFYAIFFQVNLFGTGSKRNIPSLFVPSLLTFHQSLNQFHALSISHLSLQHVVFAEIFGSFLYKIILNLTVCLNINKREH